MTYTIGIGVLIEDADCNRIRSIELDLANATGNFCGLGQPPHVTVKRPFIVNSLRDLKKTEQIMEELAAETNSFTINVNGFQNFSDKVLYLQVQKNENLWQMHNRLIASLEARFPGAKGVFEGSKMVFHATLAMDLNAQQFGLAHQNLSQYQPENFVFSVPINRIGLFLGIDQETHWSVVKETELSLPLPICR